MQDSNFICCVIRFFIIFMFLQAIRMDAQNSFFQRQNSVFESASQNWLCKELHAVNARHFECSEQHQWTKPTTGSYSLFNTEIILTESDIRSCEELVFPNGNCLRYLDLIALCDLYFPLYRKSINAKSLHEDYIYLPLLLSGNNQNFQSPDDKCGLWAMDYLTARRQHLRIDTLVDERRGGDFTTHAALQYISELNIRYERDPFQTIMAYLYGVPFVSLLKEQFPNAPFSETVPEDQRMFFKFGAYLKSLIKSTRTANQLNTCFDIFAQSEAVRFDRALQFQALVKVLQIDETQLRQTNAVYTGDYIQPGYNKVPFVMDKVAALKFEALADSVYNWKPPQPLPPASDDWEEQVITYKVKKGDSLGKIASKYSVSIKQLKQWNKIRGDKISRGQILKIQTRKKVNKPKKDIESATDDPEPDLQPESVQPATENPMSRADSLMHAGKYQEAMDYLSSVLTDTSNKKQVENALSVCRKKLNQDRLTPHAPSDKKKVIYVVKSGDSLWSIAKKHKGVTEQEIMMWNKCSSNIRPGQKLIIYPKK